MSQTKPLVAIVGRPNVGKSTLFNRLVGSQQAITDHVAGTTRDRLYGDVEWQGKVFTLIDTGGLMAPETGDTERLREAVNQQVRTAIDEADAVLLLVDAQGGLVPADTQVADVVRRSGKPTILVGNKADNMAVEARSAELYELGLGDPWLVSAIHGRATGDLLDKIIADTASVRAAEPPELGYPRVALVGRSNVGKSTLFNQLSGSDTRISDAEPHTTRDIGSTVLDTAAGRMELLDTAGLLRRGKSGLGIPKFSLLRTIRTIQEAEVACLLIDGVEGPTVQDAHIASYILEAGTAVVVVVNKWDLVDKSADVQDRFYRHLQETLGFLPSPPVIFISALTGSKVQNLPRAIYDVWNMAATEIGTTELNQTLRAAASKLPAGGGRFAPKLYYGTQIGVHPPTFKIFVNKDEAWGDNHRRYLQNVLRDTYNLLATPVRLKLQPKPPREQRVT